jgi:hypothetical protein
MSDAVKCNEGSAELKVALDVTWQKTLRQEFEQCGITDTGEVIDVEVLTKYYQRCITRIDNQKQPEAA